MNVYSARQEVLIRPLLDAFTKETGISVNVVSGDADALLKRIETEGNNSPADVLLTTDAGRLWRAKQANVLAPIASDTLEQLVPENLRDNEHYWYGLSVRARPIMVNRAIAEEPSTVLPQSYSDLAQPIYANQICIRSSGNIYNQSLVAAMLEQQSVETVESWAKSIVQNFARQPQGGDRDQIKAVAVGQCTFAIANTYYLASMLSDDSTSVDQSAAQKISVIWPNQDTTGTHINVSGAGVIKSAPNKANAIALIEFLASDAAQEIYANVNFEYPIRQDIDVHPILTAWGTFKAEDIDLTALGENNPAAVKLMDRAGWR